MNLARWISIVVSISWLLVDVTDATVSMSAVLSWLGPIKQIWSCRDRFLNHLLKLPSISFDRLSELSVSWLRFRSFNLLVCLSNSHYFSCFISINRCNSRWIHTDDFCCKSGSSCWVSCNTSSKFTDSLWSRFSLMSLFRILFVKIQNFIDI